MQLDLAKLRIILFKTTASNLLNNIKHVRFKITFFNSFEATVYKELAVNLCNTAYKFYFKMLLSNQYLSF